MVENLYIHFPFCRRKCSYCALHSRAGSDACDRKAYVAAIADSLRRFANEGVEIDGRLVTPPFSRLATVYFGGGSPAMCDLEPIFTALAPLVTTETEFTVELHPLDAADGTLERLRAGGVNRVSLGVQSLDDATLADMNRGVTARETERAFARVKRRFPNAGIDLIAGYPTGAGKRALGDIRRLKDWGLAHCSVYSLILEEKTALANRVKKGETLPGDDEALDEIHEIAEFLAECGLKRYEISSYAAKGMECRHNLATWRGEDYLGIGEGAFGRLGLCRTRNLGVPRAKPEIETVTAEADRKEREIFRLRTSDGLETSSHPEWKSKLDQFVIEGLLTRDGTRYRLTERGTEVCDTILADII